MEILQISDLHLRGDGKLSFRKVDTPACLRTPCGPSEKTTDGMPYSSSGRVDQKSLPESREAFPSGVSFPRISR